VHDVSRLVPAAAEGLSVSIKSRSAGTAAATSRRAPAERNVTMPANPRQQPSDTASAASAAVPVNECNTVASGPRAVASRSMSSVSLTLSRV